MGRQDWDYIQIPKGMSEELDLFCQSSFARELGVSNKHVLVRLLISGFLKDYSAIYGAALRPGRAQIEALKKAEVLESSRKTIKGSEYRKHSVRVEKYEPDDTSRRVAARTVDE